MAFEDDPRIVFQFESLAWGDPRSLAVRVVRSQLAGSVLERCSSITRIPYLRLPRLVGARGASRVVNRLDRRLVGDRAFTPQVTDRARGPVRVRS